MNIYLDELMKKLFIYGLDTEAKARVNILSRDEESITISQLPDIKKTKYTLIICKKSFEKITAIYNDKEYDLKLESFENHFGEKDPNDFFRGELYFLDIEFDSFMPTKLKFSFIKDIEKPYTMDIRYVYADKEDYYKRETLKRHTELVERVDFKIKTGNGLFTAFFKPCDANYAYSKIDLYLDGNELGSFENKKGLNYITVKDLADAEYSVVLEQYNEKDEVLYTSSPEKFWISSPSASSDDDDWDDYWNEYDNDPC